MLKALLYRFADSAGAILAAGIAVIDKALRLISRFLSLVHLRSVTNGRIPISTQFDGPVHAVSRANVTLGEHCRLGRNTFFETPGEGRITIGSHVRINTGSVIVSSTQIEVGDHCLIGEYVSVRDGDHGMALGELMRLQDEVAAPIKIGRDVWIGRGVAILKGVTVNDGAVIAANSVVTKDIPAGAVAGGNPASVIKSREASGRGAR